MNIVTEIKEWQSLKTKLKKRSVGFIPTMGNLHAGHMSLCRRSQAENDITVVSIVVNPTQFNQEDDFHHYPRTLEQDTVLLSSQNIDYLFCPAPDNLYPDNYQIQLSETELSLELEGFYRPGHFNGMLTIVLKLLNLIQPTRAYFGEKDYQQLLLVKKMVSALFIESEIIGCETIRDEDLLALSSRNNRLTPKQRTRAADFPKLLHSSHDTNVIKEKLIQLGFSVDYIVEKWQRRLGAVWLDEIRLIDNIPIQ